MSLSQTALWTLGLLGLLALAFLCFQLNGPGIEADVTERATAAIADPPLTGLTPSVDGNTVTLRGTVPDAAARTAAIAAMAGVPGVARVIDSLRVAASGEPRPGAEAPGADAPEAGAALAFGAVRADDGALVARGTLPAEASRERVLAALAAAYPGVEIRDEMTVRASGGAAAYPDWMDAAVAAMAPARGPAISYDGRTLVIRGTVGTEQARADIEAAVRETLPEGVTLRNEITVEAEASGDDDTGAAQVETDAGATADVQRAGEALREALSLGQVEFESGTATLTARSREILDRAAEVFTRFPSVGAEVQGHTDSQGSESSNQALSQRRAEAVLAYLTDQGVTPDALTARGYGEAEPVETNDTAEGRARNRRVVFSLASR